MLALLLTPAQAVKLTNTRLHCTIAVSRNGTVTAYAGQLSGTSIRSGEPFITKHASVHGLQSIYIFPSTQACLTDSRHFASYRRHCDWNVFVKREKIPIDL